jgi:hypothetical protein
MSNLASHHVTTDMAIEAAQPPESGGLGGTFARRQRLDSDENRWAVKPCPAVDG